MNRKLTSLNLELPSAIIRVVINPSSSNSLVVDFIGGGGVGPGGGGGIVSFSSFLCPLLARCKSNSRFNRPICPSFLSSSSRSDLISSLNSAFSRRNKLTLSLSR